MKNEKGITLIALIITIIVMIILVAVTIAFATEGGIFKRAKEAVERTQTQVDNEVSLFYMITAENIEQSLREKGVNYSVSQESLDKICDVANRFNQYSTEDNTYTLTPQDVVDCLTVFKGSSGTEYVAYVYYSIFQKAYTEGDKIESYNRRIAIINYLNEQPEIDGMLKGDFDLNSKIDIDDYNIYRLICSGENQIEYLPLKEQDFSTNNEYFNFCDYYCDVVGDLGQDSYLDTADRTKVYYYINSNSDESYFIQKYDVDLYYETEASYFNSNG